MYSIFEELCTKFGITPYKFCKDTGTNSSTISTWKKNNSLAGPDLSKKVCDYFGISMDYLMGADREDQAEHTYYLNEETAEIANQIFHNKDLRILFDASRKAKPEDLKLIIEMAKRFKSEDN